ncbi:MAG: hypothetical protein O2864_06040, partial [Crenarchaeota archaeon]|nr:hypothetical protein [Thermoproteota archaeon]
MNKELGRKITSLTLMTIMLAGSVSFALAPVMPEAEAASQYLWVSVEDSGNNKFFGGQVLEIVVSDAAIQRLDQDYGMPDVTIAGKKIIMAQGVDGSWYAYIADGSKAHAIDGNYPETEDGKGADYGRFCINTTELSFGINDGATTSLKSSESSGVAIPFQLGTTTTTIAQANQATYTQGTGIDTACTGLITTSAAGRLVHTGVLATGVNASDQAINNVVREARTLANGTTT